MVCSTTGRNYHFTTVDADTTQMWSDLIDAMVERQKDLAAQGLYVADTSERHSD